METVVPDASIILKWVLAGENKSEEETSLVLLNNWLEEKVRIILPALWYFEVGNVLGLKRPDQANAIMDILLDYRFEEAQITNKICHLALDLMRELKVSFYDASYHALAISQKATFITADKRYFDKATIKGHLQLII